MAKRNVVLHQFNRGIISPLAFARVDVARTAFSAETMVNFVPRVLGSMMLRPGTEYIGSTESDAAAKFIPFIFSTDDTALIEVTASGVRVWESETVVTRVSISTAVSSTWVDADESGGVSTVSGGVITLTGDGTNAARRRQTVPMQVADLNKAIALEVTVTRGPVTLRVGSGTGGSDDYISETQIDEGFHSIVFTPKADPTIEVESRLERDVIIDSVAFGSAGDMLLTYPTTIPWTDLDKIRWDQSGDSVFIAHENVQQYIIQRRGSGSWSLVKYYAEDGPFKFPNVANTTITPTALTGNVRLTASDPIFSSDPKGQIYRITSDGQEVSSDLSAENTFTNAIKVTGTGSQRVYTITRAGTWTATVTLQRSFTSDSGPWESLTPTYTTNGTESYDDDLSNQIIWYRIGIETGDYTSGTAELTLDYPIGSITGVARITAGPDDWVARDASVASKIWTGVAWSPSLTLFCAVTSTLGDSNQVMTSADGVTWTTRTSSSTKSWRSVTWSVTDSLFVAVSGGAGTSEVMTSPDGTNWTTRTTTSGVWLDVVESQDQSLLCAVGGGTAGNEVMTSPDGVTWTNRTGAETNNWQSIAYSEGAASPIFVAVSSDGTNRVMTSADGITWTSRSAAAANQWLGVAWSPELSLFCAVSTGGSTSDQVMTSADGITWTSRTAAIDGDWEGIVWAPDLGRFVAISNDNAEDGNVMYSEDGITWAAQTMPGELDSLLEITYSSELGVLAAVGGIDFIATSASSRFEAEAEVLQDLGGTNASTDWEEGEWSNVNGWPGAIAFAEGRLFWSGQNGIWGSVSDSFFSYDSTTVGDSGPLSRTIGSGPVDTINWMLALQRIILGAEGAEFVCKSNAFDEPLTPTNFSIKLASNQGSSDVNALRLDKSGIFVQRGGTRLLQIDYDFGSNEYGTVDLTVLQPEVCQPGVIRMAFQRQPDTRVHCVLSDGTVAMMIYDRAEEVKCWLKITTDGLIEDVVILPGDDGDSEDKVYYVVNRTINGSTVRYLERWAKESECEGGTTNKNLDSHLIYSGVSTTSITGLTHLEAETVKVWGGGKDLGSYTVSSGAITLSEAVTDAIIGLSYTGQWKSTKLAYAAREGTALLQKKRIGSLGVILRNTHYQGLQYGPDFSTLDDLPLIQDGAALSDDTVHTDYDEETIMFQGKWDSDARLCLQATSPKPCNVLAAIIGMETNEKF